MSQFEKKLKKNQSSVKMTMRMINICWQSKSSQSGFWRDFTQWAYNQSGNNITENANLNRRLETRTIFFEQAMCKKLKQHKAE